MTKFMSKSNNCNQSAIIFRTILCCGISLVLGAVLGHLLRTELFADINAEFDKYCLLWIQIQSTIPPYSGYVPQHSSNSFSFCAFFTDPMHGFSI